MFEEKFDCRTCGRRWSYDGKRYVHCPFCDHVVDLKEEDMSDCSTWIPNVAGSEEGDFYV